LVHFFNSKGFQKTKFFNFNQSINQSRNYLTISFSLQLQSPELPDHQLQPPTSITGRNYLTIRSQPPINPTSVLFCFTTPCADYLDNISNRVKAFNGILKSLKHALFISFKPMLTTQVTLWGG
jgi:hypothetical protein